ncbi:MAG: Ig-like domain-containing protein, partial [Thermodesulfobacteriota bacterium]
MADKQNGSTPHETPLPLTLSYTDLDGPGPYTFTIVSGPYDSRLSGSGTNRTYTPNRGYDGPDSFTWKVREGIADSNSATYSLAVSPSR